MKQEEVILTALERARLSGILMESRVGVVSDILALIGKGNLAEKIKKGYGEKSDFTYRMLKDEIIRECIESRDEVRKFKKLSKALHKKVEELSQEEFKF